MNVGRQIPGDSDPRYAKWLSIAVVVLLALIPIRIAVNTASGDGFPLVQTIGSAAIAVWLLPLIWFLRQRSR